VELANNLWNWPTTRETGQQPVELANNLWNWPTTCGTGQQPAELANNLWNWPTTCGTGQRPVELANNLWNWPKNLWNWPVTCMIMELRSTPSPNLMELINIKQPCRYYYFLVLLVSRGRRGPALSLRPDRNKLAAFLFFMSLLSKVNDHFLNIQTNNEK
jgi:hypothetical protein